MKFIPSSPPTPAHSSKESLPYARKKPDQKRPDNLGMIKTLL
jgi:hypothetical protein